MDNRIEQAKADGFFSSQISDNLFGAYSPDGLLGVGRTEATAWMDLFYDMDNGTSIVGMWDEKDILARELWNTPADQPPRGERE